MFDARRGMEQPGGTACNRPAASCTLNGAGASVVWQARLCRRPTGRSTRCQWPLVSVGVALSELRGHAETRVDTSPGAALAYVEPYGGAAGALVLYCFVGAIGTIVV